MCSAIRVAAAGLVIAALGAWAHAQPAATRTADTRPAATQPVATQPASKPATTQPTASLPAPQQRTASQPTSQPANPSAAAVAPPTSQPAQAATAPAPQTQPVAASQPTTATAPGTSPAPPKQPELAVKDGEVVVFLGDDLTDTPRPTNTNSFPMLVESFMTVRYPDVHARYINVGWSGDTVARALLRLDRDVLSNKPAVVVVCLGLNDAEYQPLAPERLAAYRQDLTTLVSKCQKAGARVWLLSPPCVDEDKGRKVRIQRAGRPGMTDLKTIHYNAALQAYAAAMKEIAAQSHCGFADWFGESLAAQSRGRQADPDFSLSTNGINPTDRCHALAAATLLRAWGATPIELSIDLNWATGEARLKSDVPSAAVTRTEITASGERRITLHDLPLPWPMAGGQAGFLGADWEAAAMCKFMLQIPDGPERGVGIRIDWPQGVVSLDQPVPSEQLRTGFNLAATETINSAKEITELYQLIGTKNYYHYGTWRKLALSPPKEAELVEAHRKLIEAWNSYVAGTEKIIQNQPKRFDLLLVLAEAVPAEQLPTNHATPRKPAAPPPAQVAPPIPIAVPAASQPIAPEVPATRPAPASASAPS